MDPYSLPSIQQSSNSNESIVGMPARPSPAGGASSYSKSLPLPPPLSPTKFSSATFPSASTSQAAAPSSRPSTPAGSRALVDDLHDSPDDGSNSLLASSHTAVPSGATGGRKDVRRRAYFADVVLPSSHPSSSSSSSSDELDFLLSTLGDVLSSTPFPPGQDTLPLPQPSSSTPGRMTRSDSVDLTSTAQGGGGQAAGVSKPDSRKLEPLMDEFLTTERTYVRRLNALKKTYADPLRLFAKDPSMSIIPLYNATLLFGNLDALVGVNEAFLRDLEGVVAGGAGGGGQGVGEVALNHFKHLRAFDCYKTYYDACEDAQLMLQDLLARRRGFAEFVQASRYKTEGVSGVGLKELLMEPVQRIPRYTMMWSLMIKYMDPLDPERAKLLEATEIARSIAGSEKDEVTRRGMVLMGLGRSVDGFPAELINNNRDYLSSLDVEDLPSSGPSADPSTPSSQPLLSTSSSSNLHATLILFSDRLLITKRPSAASSGRKITGLEDVAKLWKGGMNKAPSGHGRHTPSGHSTGGGGGAGDMSDSGNHASSSSSNKNLTSKALAQLTDVVAVDLGSGDFSLHFPHAFAHASNSSTAWTRPHRFFSVVHPPKPLSASDSQRVKLDKGRFVGNLWAAQALVRARKGGSEVVIGREEERFGSITGGGSVDRARGYLNVWKRDEWEEDPTKAKVVVQVDETGSTEFLRWEADGMRRVKLLIKVQPLTGGLTRVGVRTRETEEKNEIIPTTSVYSHMLQTIHRYGVYIPRQDSRSAPPTPTHVSSRRPILGLDALSRNLFGSTSSRSDFTVGSLSHKRTRSAASKSSGMTTDSSSVTRSTISSLANSRIGVGSVECDSPARPTPAGPSTVQSGGPGSRSPTSPSHRRSPGAMSRSGSTSPFSARKPVPIDEEMLVSEREEGGADDGEEEEEEEDMSDLGKQLALARKNSRSAGARADREIWTTTTTTEVEQVEMQSVPYPQTVPQPSFSRPQTPPLEEAVRRAKTPELVDDSFFSRAKSPAADSRRPHGPRAPTPSGTPGSSTAPLRRYAPSPGHERGSSHTIVHNLPSSVSKSRSRRVSDEWRNARPSPVAVVPSTTPGPFEDAPESPSSVSSGQKRERESVDQASPVLDKKIRTENRSPLSPPPHPPAQVPVAALTIRKSSLPGVGSSSQGPRRVSGAGVTKRNFEADKESISAHVEDRAVGAAKATQEDIVDSRKSTKRIKLEVEGLRSHFSKNIAQKERLQRVGETGVLPRSPPSRNISIRASSRIDAAREMYENASASDRQPSTSSSSRKSGVDVAFLTDWCEVLEGLIGELDGGLARASVNSDRLSADILSIIEVKKLTAFDVTTIKAKLHEARQQLDQAQRLLEAQKSELLDAKNENAALYEAFNEELEQMYADMTLPGAESNFAMKRDLQMTKADRNALRLENATLKREFEHAMYEKERYECILREHGLLQ